MTASRKTKTVLLASPRGFCAGVDRAIQIVEESLKKYGAPVYVRHEIVHNRHVVTRLEGLGAIFVEELDECPDDRPVVFSAHGVPKSVPKAAAARDMNFLDATCPLVSKVHVEAERHHGAGKHILLIGHEGHPEVVGTMGQLAPGEITLIETEDDARTYAPRDPDNLALVTQTTLSVDDTADLIAILQSRFPNLALPYKEDICYATTNRQAAVKAIAAECDLMLVIGSVTSSNSKRLVEVGEKVGADEAYLISSAASIDWAAVDRADTIGLSAGASAPEYLVDGVLAALRSRYEIEIREIRVTEERVVFRLPRQLLPEKAAPEAAE
ncbi:4-hydroxy-3-methylbut-2-enyl diphosphate reductase [uncultured Algimonas sp.]|uniref:4-hydroxy-3-methylbut-2-enyl diphosphate reductase n=1 Tax=uncultured Algimonas sp. TaxID=1547920 RepID=UPI00261B18E6|nr:4-hydroxy-3-methylbut-2-enyl diphosphate reductase [uncultured Algimonas sp.]